MHHLHLHWFPRVTAPALILCFVCIILVTGFNFVVFHRLRLCDYRHANLHCACRRLVLGGWGKDKLPITREPGARPFTGLVLLIHLQGLTIHQAGPERVTTNPHNPTDSTCGQWGWRPAARAASPAAHESPCLQEGVGTSSALQRRHHQPSKPFYTKQRF